MAFVDIVALVVWSVILVMVQATALLCAAVEDWALAVSASLAAGVVAFMLAVLALAAVGVVS